MSEPPKNWTLEQAQALAEQLEAAERTTVLNKRQLIGEVMYPTIAAKLKLGWSYQAVCEELAQLGIEVTPHTLRTYLKSRAKTRRHGAGGRSAVPAKVVPSREGHPKTSPLASSRSSAPPNPTDPDHDASR